MTPTDPEETSTPTSEFGAGLTYCLGLFLAHAERDWKIPEVESSLWFDGAADHFFDMIIPKTLPVVLQERLEAFAGRCIKHRLERTVPPSEKEWAIQEAKNLLLEIDKAFGVAAIKGDWE